MAIPSIKQSPSSNNMEGDPPIGKEWGALGVGTGPTLPQKSPGSGEGVPSLEGKVMNEGELNIREEILTSSPPPNPLVRNQQEDHPPALAKEEGSLLELMKRKRKEKEDSTVKMKPVRKKRGAKKEEEVRKAASKEEEDRKAAEQMRKMMKKMGEAPVDKAYAAKNSGEVDLSCEFVVNDRKTNVDDEEDNSEKTVGEEGRGRRTQGSPLGKVRAALRKFSHTDRQEESYEEWKKKKLTRKAGEKRKAVVDEDPGTEEINNIVGTPYKARRIMVPGQIQDLKSKINYVNTRPKISGGREQVQLES